MTLIDHRHRIEFILICGLIIKIDSIVYPILLLYWLFILWPIGGNIEIVLIRLALRIWRSELGRFPWLILSYGAHGLLVCWHYVVHCEFLIVERSLLHQLLWRIGRQRVRLLHNDIQSFDVQCLVIPLNSLQLFHDSVVLIDRSGWLTSVFRRIHLRLIVNHYLVFFVLSVVLRINQA